MADHGKRTEKAREGIDRNKRYEATDAFDMILQRKFVKFDETVDVAFRLGVDPRHADQMVRGTALLPNGTGRSVRVLAFAAGDKAKEAQEAGADVIGLDDLVEKINGGWLEFDKVVATPDVMAKVGKLGKVLGPRGLMPNPKLGTVTFDVGKAVRDLKAGKVEFKVDKAGNLHAVVGKASFGKDKLVENFKSLLEAVQRAKPSGVKGIYIRNVAVSTTMGPAVKVAVLEVAA
ncbi:MAG: 50S ribosomal protein L1 [Nitrospirae bacterium]|nr:50S ribosomal protein L1 [Nitrospirota bacterium]